MYGPFVDIFIENSEDFKTFKNTKFIAFTKNFLY